MDNEGLLTKQDMQDFFSHIDDLQVQYVRWTGVPPKKLVINDEIIRKLSKVEGFYQRPELKAEVTAYAPMVRYFKLSLCVVTIIEDYEERFVHFE